ncbi:RfaG Glycosyltransferase [Burkholderiales bacterium]
MIKKIKIVHVQLLPLLSGVQRVTLDEMAQLDSSIFDRIVVCKCEGELTERLELIGVKFYLIPQLMRELSPVNDFFAFWSLLSFMIKQRPDIVHTHSSKTGILGRFAAFIANVPTIIHTVHGYSFQGEPSRVKKILYRFLEFIAAAVSTKIIVLNEEDRDLSVSFVNVAKNKLLLIPNGVDTDNFSPPSEHLKVALKSNFFGVCDPNHIIIGMVARLSPQKNPICFIEAAFDIAERFNHVSFVLIGDGELRSSLEEMIKSSPHANRFFLLGWRKDVSQLLRSFDLFVLPSLWEGLPLSVLEAMSVGVPVIASNIPGNKHIVSHNFDGRLFLSDDASSLSVEIESLIIDSSLRQLYSKRARKKVINSYSLTLRTRTVSLLYRSFSDSFR